MANGNKLAEELSRKYSKDRGIVDEEFIRMEEKLLSAGAAVEEKSKQDNLILELFKLSPKERREILRTLRDLSTKEYEDFDTEKRRMQESLEDFNYEDAEDFLPPYRGSEQEYKEEGGQIQPEYRRSWEQPEIFPEHKQMTPEQHRDFEERMKRNKLQRELDKELHKQFKLQSDRDRLMKELERLGKQPSEKFLEDSWDERQEPSDNFSQFPAPKTPTRDRWGTDYYNPDKGGVQISPTGVPSPYEMGAASGGTVKKKKKRNKIYKKKYASGGRVAKYK